MNQRFLVHLDINPSNAIRPVLAISQSIRRFAQLALPSAIISLRRHCKESLRHL
jgi:hypothetical protein